MSVPAALTEAEAQRIIRATAEVIPGRQEADFFLTCEHASWHVPQPWHNLGLSPAQLQDHIGWDIGAGDVTRGLARALGAPAVLAGYSRLFVECNRLEDAADFVAPCSDGVAIPGNQHLDAAEIGRRKRLAYDPFHQALADTLASMGTPGRRPVLVSIHTFSPSLKGETRPWHIGILWKRDHAQATALYETLMKNYGGDIGWNQPYDANRYMTMAIDHHALPRGLDHVVVEIRNDLTGKPADIGRWVDLLARSLREARLVTCERS